MIFLPPLSSLTREQIKEHIEKLKSKERKHISQRYSTNSILKSSSLCPCPNEKEEKPDFCNSMTTTDADTLILHTKLIQQPHSISIPVVTPEARVSTTIQNGSQPYVRMPASNTKQIHLLPIVSSTSSIYPPNFRKSQNEMN